MTIRITTPKLRARLLGATITALFVSLPALADPVHVTMLLKEESAYPWASDFANAVMKDDLLRAQYGNPTSAYPALGRTRPEWRPSGPMRAGTLQGCQRSDQLVTFVFPDGTTDQRMNALMATDSFSGAVPNTQVELHSGNVAGESLYRPYNKFDNPNDYAWHLDTINAGQALALTSGRARVGVFDGGVQLSILPLVYEFLEPTFAGTSQTFLSRIRKHLSLRFVSDTANAAIINGDIEGPGPARAHGTHVLGLVGAALNGAGIAGACPSCSLALLRITEVDTDPDRGSHVETAARIAISMGIQVINTSFANVGSSWTSASTLYKCAADRDIVWAASIGNSRQTVDVPESSANELPYPAAAPNVLAIGAAAVRRDPAAPANDPNICYSNIIRFIWNESTMAFRHFGTPGLNCAVNQPVNPEAERCGPAPGNSVSPECGSSKGNKLFLLAPGAQILSTIGENYIGTETNTPPCTPSSHDGFGVCSGTSMASPLVAGTAGLMRSINPLLHRESVKTLLDETASIFGGYPDQPINEMLVLDEGEAAQRTVGRVNNVWVKNRLTPLFALYSNHSVQGTGRESWLFTSNPQDAMAAIYGELYLGINTVTPNVQFSATIGTNRRMPYFSDENLVGTRYRASAATRVPASVYNFSDPGVNYPVSGGPSVSSVPRASVYLLTMENLTDTQGNPVALKPLYRLSSACTSTSASGPATVRKHTYSSKVDGAGGIATFIGSPGTNTCNYDQANYFTHEKYNLDGVEGYLLANPLPGTVAMHRVHHTGKNAWALVTETQLAQMIFVDSPFYGYSVPSAQTFGPSLLGYAYPNVDADGDGLIDGFETLIGTNPNNANSDCEGGTDLQEFPISTFQSYFKDPMAGGTCGAGTKG